MNIAFDAKRAYQNNTGLGHYSRTLIKALASKYPQHQYYLAAPKITELFNVHEYKNVHEITPTGIGKTFSSLWRSNWVKGDLKRAGIDLYHGLSHEIPVGINRTGIKSVVTIHDLIFEKFPNQYNPIDVNIYRKKFRYSCKNADRIIAISEQTKSDIIKLYNIAADKVSVVYNSCDPSFMQKLSVEEIDEVKKRFNLPSEYLLYVGSIIERKNLLRICEALNLLREKVDTPLVVIGANNNSYMRKVKTYIEQHKLKDRVIFLSEQFNLKGSKDLPAIYQAAAVMLYPSLYEGFGLPILEAMYSGLPVITSNVSCMPEVGGNAAEYVDPLHTDSIAEAIYKVYSDSDLREKMINKGLLQSKKFILEYQASEVMNIYTQLVGN